MAFSSSLPSVKILKTSQISPPQRSTPQTSLPLTFFDLIWLHADPVERLFFYRYPCSTSHFIDSILPTLKSSLSTTLQSFYPLTGTLRRIPGSDNEYDLNCSDGGSVSLTVAEWVDGDFVTLSGRDPCEVSNLRPLLPRLAKLENSCALLAIQMTVFPGDGVVAGTALHHVACDGTSINQFLHSWTSACRSGGSAVAATNSIPIIDRTLIPDPQGLLYNSYLQFASRKNRVKHADLLKKDLLLANFTLTQAHIKTLKEAVLAKTDQEKPFHLSTFVVTLAYSWVGFVKLRQHLSPGKKRAHLCFLADFRARIEPTLSAAYFGNCVGPCFVEADVGELIGGDGLAAAAEAIGRAVEGLNGSFQSALEWPTRLVSFAKEQPNGVAGSPKFRVYDVDFGWGRPVKVEIPSIVESEAISFAESREDPGGVEIGFALPKHGIEFLVNYLANGLKLLSG